MDKETLKALLAEIIAEEETLAPVAVKHTRGTYTKTRVRIENLLRELTEADVALKESIRVRKEAEVISATSRAKVEELLVEARKLKVPQVMIGEALNITRGAVSSRLTHARKSVRKRNTTK